MIARLPTARAATEGAIDTDLAVGVDIGGTKIAAGVVDRQGRVLARLVRPTPTDSPEAIDTAVADVVLALSAEYRVATLGVAAAGFIGNDHSTVAFAANLPWRDYDLGAALARMTNLPVVVENDANAAGWGEARFGAGRGHADLIVLTLGTGVGGAIISESRLVRGGNGMGAELGHLRLVPDGLPCGCGQRGCWEQYVSGSALGRTARVVAGENPRAAAAVVAAADGDPSAIGARHVVAAARAGDPVAQALLDELGSSLGAGLASMAAVLDPTTVILAGGLAEEADLYMPAARAEMARLLPASAHRPVPTIGVATLGAAAGLVGAADTARRIAEARGLAAKSGASR